jgi:hypothetical protein
LRAGDAEAARTSPERAQDDVPPGDTVEGLARVAYLELDVPQAIETWQRAYAAHRRDHDPVGAVRVARTLTAMYGAVVRDPEVANG